MLLLELAREIGLQPKRVASTRGGEYHSACPACGGVDRFFIQPSRPNRQCEGFYKCRQCDISGDTIQFLKAFFGLSYREALQKVYGNIDHRQVGNSAFASSFSLPTLTAPAEAWQKRALDFTLWAHKNIFKQTLVVDALTSRGITKEAIERFQIGFCERPLTVPYNDFGLESQKHMQIPKGIVIPTFDGPETVIRIKIRRSDWVQGSSFAKYWAMPGSMSGLNIIGEKKNSCVFVVESELDAFSLCSVANDILFSIAIGSNTKTPDTVSDYWAKRRNLYICHDNDEGGARMLQKWTALYSHAQPLPVPFGKDVGEAVQMGLNMREWLHEAGINTRL